MQIHVLSKVGHDGPYDIDRIVIGVIGAFSSLVTLSEKAHLVDLLQDEILWYDTFDLDGGWITGGEWKGDGDEG